MDYFTKWVEAFALTDMKAETVAKVLVEQIVCRFGVPRTLLTDQGANFVSSLMQEVCQLLGIRKLTTTAYHPACDGMVERFNRTVEAMLSMYVKTSQNDWDKILPYVCFAYRSSVHESTGESPFFLNFGRDPVLPLDVFLRSEEAPEDVADFIPALVHRLNETWKLANKAVSTAQARQKFQHDKKSRNLPFVAGDHVYLHVPVTTGKSRKFARFWRGPYRILSITDDGTGAYIEPVTKSTKSVPKRVNVRRLKRSRGSIADKQTVSVPPEPDFGPVESEIGASDDESPTEEAKLSNERSPVPDQNSSTGQRRGGLSRYNLRNLPPR